MWCNHVVHLWIATVLTGKSQQGSSSYPYLVHIFICRGRSSPSGYTEPKCATWYLRQFNCHLVTTEKTDQWILELQHPSECKYMHTTLHYWILKWPVSATKMYTNTHGNWLPKWFPVYCTQQWQTNCMKVYWVYLNSLQLWAALQVRRLVSIQCIRDQSRCSLQRCLLKERYRGITMVGSDKGSGTQVHVSISFDSLKGSQFQIVLTVYMYM